MSDSGSCEKKQQFIQYKTSPYKNDSQTDDENQSVNQQSPKKKSDDAYDVTFSSCSKNAKQTKKDEHSKMTIETKYQPMTEREIMNNLLEASKNIESQSNIDDCQFIKPIKVPTPHNQTYYVNTQQDKSIKSRF